MHLFRSHKETPGMFRGHAYFNLPNNPICWLVGHRARVDVIESKYSEPWVRIECSVCGLRYANRDAESHIKDLRLEDEQHGPLTGRELRALQGERRKELAARQVEVARRDPAMVAASASGREGYGHSELELSIEAHWYGADWSKVRENIGFNLHVGGRGSETPFDGYVMAGLGSLFWSVGGVGGRFAERLGGGHKRDLQLRVHGGSLWWKLWYDDDGGMDRYHDCDRWRRPKVWPWSAGRKKARAWMCLRDGNIDVNPVDAFWGGRRFHYEPVGEERNGWVSVKDFIGDEYVVKFQLERERRHRDHGPGWAREETVSWGAKWDARECQVPGVEGTGIPIRNHEWKGDTVLASGVGGIPEELVEHDTWLAFAAEKVVAQIRRDRTHHGYSPPKALRFEEQGASS